MKKVLLIFKTHLDCGYTDLAKNVVDRYIKSYIPKAIRLAEKTDGTEYPFVWNTGSWLLNEALKRDENGKVKRAIEKGYIHWHALPFTTHTELMNDALFQYGLQISKRLDDRFFKKTVAAKMTDVPGHTRGMVKYLVRAGVRVLHIGINPATPMPNVPPIFVWQSGDAKLITVVNSGGYGGSFEFDDCVVEFCMTGDNGGPQSVRDVKKLYREMSEKYPSAEIKAVSLNEFAEKLCASELVKNLPVITEEIGDTWIHGAGTDPKKIAEYRYLLRCLQKNAIQKDMEDSLLLLPEHTCGLCVMKYFNKGKVFFPAELEKVLGSKAAKLMEASWQEQRDYVDKAAQKLGLSIDKEFFVEKPRLEEYEQVNGLSCPVEITYQLFDNGDYERYKKEYLQISVRWAIFDFTKVGLPTYVGGTFVAKATATYRRGEEIVYQLSFDRAIKEKCGLPDIYVFQNGEKLEVRWFGKKANRAPEAYWLKFLGQEENWKIHKFGEWIDPTAVLGSPYIHAIEKGISNGEVEIESLDACLVAPFGRKLLHYNEGTGRQDLYFNLYNNIWNTNFPLWFSDDMKYRFVVRKIKKNERQ